MDIVVMNFALDHEPYLDDRYDVQVVDHSLATNAGGIIFRNTPFARRFVANWAAMAREYPWPFADNGALLEALASTWPTYTRRGRPCAELAIHNEHRTHGGRAFFECYQEVFAEAAGAPYSDGVADRAFGRVRLVAATRGFNNHSWKPKRHAGNWHPSVAWRPGMFVLHAKTRRSTPRSGASSRPSPRRARCRPRRRRRPRAATCTRAATRARASSRPPSSCLLYTSPSPRDRG